MTLNSLFNLHDTDIFYVKQVLWGINRMLLFQVVVLHYTVENWIILCHVRSPGSQYSWWHEQSLVGKCLQSNCGNQFNFQTNESNEVLVGLTQAKYPPKIINSKIIRNILIMVDCCVRSWDEICWQASHLLWKWSQVRNSSKPVYKGVNMDSSFPEN